MEWAVGSMLGQFLKTWAARRHGGVKVKAVSDGGCEDSGMEEAVGKIDVGLGSTLFDVMSETECLCV